MTVKVISEQEVLQEAMEVLLQHMDREGRPLLVSLADGRRELSCSP